MVSVQFKEGGKSHKKKITTKQSPDLTLHVFTTNVIVRQTCIISLI